ncbi:FecR family protein [Marinilabiliaceae bacterium JC017]|nr:FecR family protein [Marinilabiliaceae bacterium JC017]
MNKNQIWKYITGELDETEAQKVAQWIKQDKSRIRLYADMKKTWALTGQSHQYTPRDVSNNYTRFNKRYLTSPKRHTLTSQWLKYAAIFILAFGVSYFMQDQFSSTDIIDKQVADVVIETMPGQTSKTTLPDGSVAWLNSNSKLTFSAGFGNNNKRQLQLEGEVFLEVTKDPSKPFTVATPYGINIEVLGTSFNLEAYNDQFIKTTLIEGSVAIKNNSGHLLAQLKPGQQALASPRENKITITNVNTEFYTSWKEGILIFKDIPFVEIAPRLERFYNIKIEFANEAAKHIKINGRVLRNYPVDQFFEVIKVLSGINYTIHTSTDQPAVITIY